jgi:aminoglycoside 6'-N-acetyltransferase
MSLRPYHFRPMSGADLPLVRHWLETPHVARWWGDPEEQFALVKGDLETTALAQFIVSVDKRPLAYLQCYEQGRRPENGRHPPDTQGIDLFIGESDMVGRGRGSALIRTFVERLLAAGAPRVLTDPDPANARAVRAYAKAGFRPDCLVDTPDGLALLMVCTP